MDVAYSIEYRDVIDPEKAYELYWEDIINDTQAFTCPEPGCEAQVTLSSVTKERRYLRQVPHYRCFGFHKKDCPNDKKQKTINDKDDGKIGDNNRYIDQTIDILLLDRQNKTIETTKDTSKDGSLGDRIKRKYKSNVEKQGKRESKYLTIMPIVTKFLDYKDKNKLFDNVIINQGKELYYGTVFVDLNNKVFNNFSSFYRVYYGDAKIYRVKNREKDFIISFLKEVTCNEKSFRPSAYISEKIIDNSYRKVKWLIELEELASSSEVVKAFIYGTIVINKSSDDAKEFLNINICRAKLDLVDLRHIED